MPTLPPLSLLEGAPQSLRVLLESIECQAAPAALSVALGRSPNGGPYVTDLAAMPHLAIGGAPGSGKTTFLKGLLTTMLARCTTTDLRLVLVDTSGGEFQRFEDLPHLIAPVVTEPGHGVMALQCATREMERRYRIIAAAGARSIRRYNKGRTRARLPSIVLVVTEIAPLMRHWQADVEETIWELGYAARPAGIHLILATDDLSPMTFSDLINVSVPARMCFKVSSRSDSLTMLARYGAEALATPGDALYLPPGSATPMPLRAPLVSDDDVDRITSFWRDLPERLR